MYFVIVIRYHPKIIYKPLVNENGELLVFDDIKAAHKAGLDSKLGRTYGFYIHDMFKISTFVI